MIVTPPPPPSSSSTTSLGSSINNIPDGVASVGGSNGRSRGAFIVFEGVDRCGKTTQVGLIVKHLIKKFSVGAAAAAVAMRFPDRTTVIGQMIDQYLRDKSTQLDDHAVHLLFSANRWEVVPTLKSHLYNGTTVVCDRYAYSGVAFSSAKVVVPTAQQQREKVLSDSEMTDSIDQQEQQQPVMSMEWCQGPDIGLPAPDAVIFLDLSQDEAEKRGGYGGERYETRELQSRVRERFSQLQALDEHEGIVPWHIVDAARSVEDVQQEIQEIVERTIRDVQQRADEEEGAEPASEADAVGGKPLQLLWQTKNDCGNDADNNKENLRH